MARFILAFFMASILPQLVFAQNPSVQDSRAFLVNGVSFYNSDNYAKALSQYQKVHRNDTNYEEACFRLAECYEAMEKYEQGIAYCIKGIKLNKELVPDFYIQLASLRSETKEFEQLMEELDSAISRFPFNYDLKVEKGKAMIKAGEQEQGLEAIYNVLLENPVHPGAHLALADICYDRELFGQSVVSYAMYLALAEKGDGALRRLLSIDEKLSQKLTGGDEYPGAEKYLEQGFEEIDLLVSNKTAIGKKYKTPSKLTYPIVKQTHLVLSRLESVSGDGFWHDFYIPFLLNEVHEAGYFSGMSYAMLSSAEEVITDVGKTLSKKSSETSAFRHVALPEIYKWAINPVKDENGDILEGKFFYSDATLIGLGELNTRNQKDGLWLWFYRNGQVASKGKYDENVREGEWFSYYKNGVMKTDVFFKRDKLNGEYVAYYDNGNKMFVANYDNGVRDGEYIYYYRLGGKMNVRNYNDGYFDGIAYDYYRNGEVQHEVQLDNGTLDGEFKTFYDDGSLKETQRYENGTLQGKSVEYHRNGQVKTEYHYTDGLKDGRLKSYYDDGTLHEEGQFSEGRLVGESKVYYTNGKLKVHNTFDENGKRNGKSEVYDEEGRKTSEYEYRKGDLIGYTFYDLEGNVIHTASNSGRTVDYVEYDVYGNVRGKGVFEKGEKEGEWKYFAPGNCMTKKFSYSEGDLDGIQYEYFRNGELSEKYDMDEGYATGDYNSYFSNQVRYIYGYRVTGERQGDWEYRNPNNVLDQKLYFHNGQIEGWNEYYSPGGKLASEVYYEFGSRLKAVYYDTASNVMQEVALDNGTGTFVIRYPNGDIRFEGHYLNGIPHGEFKWFYPNGKIETTGAYFNQERHGEWIWYHRNGKKKTQTYYWYGSKDSTRTEWYDDGTISYTSQYDVNGDVTGIATGYYPGTGTKRYEITYREGEKQGESRYYGENGELMHKRLYIDGWLIRYAVQGKDGKMGEYRDISTDGTMDHVVAYYKNGNVAMDFNFKYGWLEGEYTWNYSNGKTYFTEFFKESDEEGESKHYLKNGTLIAHEQYSYGRLNGKCSYYYSNGKPKREVTYIMGDKEGVVKIYDQQGKLTGTAYYFDDEYYDGDKN